MLMTLLTLAIASGLSAVMDLRLFRDHMVRDLRVLAAVVGESCVSALVFNSKESAEQRLATLAGEYQVATATLYNASGEPFAQWRRPSEGFPGLAGEAVEIAHPLEFDGRPVGRLVLAARLLELDRQARIYGWLAAAVTLVTLAIAWLIALNLRRRISWPITALEDATRAVSEKGDFSVRVPALRAGREIDSLAKGFNRMLAQIEQREGALREANAVLRRLATDLSRTTARCRSWPWRKSRSTPVPTAPAPRRAIAPRPRNSSGRAFSSCARPSASCAPCSSP